MHYSMNPKDKYPADYPELADEILDHFGRICHSLGIIWYLSAGTCLGFYREGTYIEGDNDIDIRIIGDNGTLDILFEAIQKEGFIPSPHPNFRRVHFRKSNILLDIKKVHGEIPHLAVIFHNKQPYRIPYYTEDYLTRLYGPDWGTPQQILLRSHKD